jgi:predicted transposase YdaD
MFPALTEALRSVDPKTAISFYDIILAGLPVPARERWEAHMTTTVGQPYRSELFRRLYAEGEAHGEARGETRGHARGEAEAILTVLDEQGIAVPTHAREAILACTDLDQLTTWLRRAVRARTIDDVLTP